MKHNLDRIFFAVHCEPWAILPERHRAIVSALDKHLAGTGKASALDMMETDGEDEAKPFDIVGSVGVIAIEGTILNKCSGLETLCGAFSLQTFKANLKELAANPLVKSIVLNISSGGGSVGGVPEAADVIAAVADKMPVYAYTDDVCASAAYWLASQAGGVFLSKSAIMGSIGVYSAIVDESKAWEKAGLKLELFKAGKFKADGIEGGTLSDDAKEQRQARVDKIYGDFTAAILSKRPNVSADTMQGQVFCGKEAVACGLADGVIDDLDALIAYLNSGK